MNESLSREFVSRVTVTVAAAGINAFREPLAGNERSTNYSLILNVRLCGKRVHSDSPSRRQKKGTGLSPGIQRVVAHTLWELEVCRSLDVTRYCRTSRWQPNYVAIESPGNVGSQITCWQQNLFLQDYLVHQTVYGSQVSDPFARFHLPEM